MRSGWRDDTGCLGTSVAWAVFVAFLMCVGGMAALPVLNGSGLSWDTSAAQSWQAQRVALEQTRQSEETARTVVREQEQTARSLAWQHTLQVVAVMGGVAGTLVVVAVQAGRTVRHESTQRTERIRLCEGYIDRYLPDARAEVRTLPGRGVVVVDHDTQAVTPCAIVRRVMAVQQYDDG